MKTMISKIVLSLSVSVLLVSCGSGTSVSDPEEIGEQVMDIVNDFDDMSKEDFRDRFMSMDEIRELGKNETVVKDENGRNRLTKMNESDRTRDLDRGYDQIKENVARYDIDMAGAEYDDFAYEVKTKRGIKTVRGELYFKSDGKRYRMRTTSIYDGSGYNLVQLDGPRLEE